MTIPVNIPSKMIVDDSSSSCSSPESSILAAVMKERRKRKKKRSPMVGNTFSDLYKVTGESLGEGSCGKVETCVNVFTGIEYAVKIIEKIPGVFNRSRILKEIELYHLCRGQQNIIQLIEYFEESDCFYLVFEKMGGGPLLEHIQRRVCFTEAEAAKIVGQIAGALLHLHQRGVAHRDLKPDNVLCANSNSPCPVKLADFDLCSEASIEISTPRLLTPVGSVEYMAPEVVDTFLIDDYAEDDDESICYTKKCDLWSLGVIMYILLCGYAPFSGSCGSQCGWDRGESCTDCQERLFSSIKEGALTFPHTHWHGISPQAKDLIQRLLVKNSQERLDASEVLNHPWVLNGGSTTCLDTPQNLRRQNSLRDLEDFATRAIKVNRAVHEIEGQTQSQSIILNSPTNSSCSLLQRRRKGFSMLSIEEMDTDSLPGSFS